MMRKKCIWSNQYSDDLIEINTTHKSDQQSYFVLPEYETQTNDFLVYIDKHSTRFMVSLITLLLIMSIAVAVLEPFREFIVGGCLVLLGVLMMKYPFATPQTVEMMGFRSSIKFVKGLSIVVMVLGVIIGLLG